VTSKKTRSGGGLTPQGGLQKAEPVWPLRWGDRQKTQFEKITKRDWGANETPTNPVAPRCRGEKGKKR